MPDGSMMKNGKHPKGITAKQKANLPPALLQAIMRKNKGKK
jgi:hypothetical protein